MTTEYLKLYHCCDTLRLKIMSQFIIDTVTQSYFSFQVQYFSMDCFRRFLSKKKIHETYKLYDSCSLHDNGYDKIYQPNLELRQSFAHCSFKNLIFILKIK